MPTRRTVLAAFAGAFLARPAQKATAYSLIGDRYHNSDYARTGLTRTIEKDMGVTIDFCDDNISVLGISTSLYDNKIALFYTLIYHRVSFYFQ